MAVELHIAIPIMRRKPKKKVMRDMDVRETPEGSDLDLGDILGEFRLLVAVSGILFGFLLNLSVTATHITGDNLVILTVALSFSALSILAFLLPVIYHHTHVFPLTAQQKSKFYLRTHRFALWGIGTLILSVYFSVVLALHTQLGTLAYLLSILLFAFPVVLFVTRKVDLKP